MNRLDPASFSGPGMRYRRWWASRDIVYVSGFQPSKERNVIKRSGSSEILHEVVAHNGVLNLAGVVAEDLAQGMAGQARQVFEEIDRLLAANGSDRNHLLSALIFITDMKLKPEMNKAWQAWLKKEHLPTRATIGINDLGPGVLIEVVVTAAVK
jgi:enamine deaminase RidA (YjgF/YER057c/UK114 family)